MLETVWECMASHKLLVFLYYPLNLSKLHPALKTPPPITSGITHTMLSFTIYFLSLCVSTKQRSYLISSTDHDFQVRALTLMAHSKMSPHLCLNPTHSNTIPFECNLSRGLLTVICPPMYVHGHQSFPGWVPFPISHYNYLWMGLITPLWSLIFLNSRFDLCLTEICTL